MRPTRSTTNRRPEPSNALATLVGSLKPSATLTSASFGALGIFPPGLATSAFVCGARCARSVAPTAQVIAAAAHTDTTCLFTNRDIDKVALSSREAAKLCHTDAL